MIVAIDGPAGAGKSTVARTVAKRLRFLYIDTGAMYRALTLKALEENIDLKDEAKLIQMANGALIDLRNTAEGSLEIYLDNQDVTQKIRGPRITQFVSDIAKIKGLREAMLKIQRALGNNQDAVLEGRDIGTVVFPDADYKFFLDADLKERARRRYQELKDAGQEIALGEVKEDVIKRDKIDSTRKVAPLKKAPDAIYIDTTAMSIKEVAGNILNYIQKNPSRSLGSTPPLNKP